jgi:hypothetical protein
MVTKSTCAMRACTSACVNVCSQACAHACVRVCGAQADNPNPPNTPTPARFLHCCSLPGGPHLHPRRPRLPGADDRRLPPPRRLRPRQAARPCIHLSEGAAMPIAQTCCATSLLCNDSTADRSHCVTRARARARAHAHAHYLTPTEVDTAEPGQRKRQRGHGLAGDLKVRSAMRVRQQTKGPTDLSPQGGRPRRRHSRATWGRAPPPSWQPSEPAPPPP